MTPTRTAERRDQGTVTDPRPTPSAVVAFVAGVVGSLALAAYLGFIGLFTMAPLFGDRPDGEELRQGTLYLLLAAAAVSLPWFAMWWHTRTRGWAVAALVVAGLAFAFAIGVPLNTPTD